VVTQHRSGHLDAYATASKTATEDDQIGWRVLGGELSSLEHAEAGAYYRGSHGNVYGEASASRGQSALRAGTAGALVLADGNLFSTRRIEQSYAVVEVKDFDNVGVGIGGNVLATTDAKGVALVPNLTPFVVNQIRLNPQDLPVSAEIDSIEDVVVPPLRSAVKLRFPVRSGRAALLRITLDDGEPVPPGAIVRVAGDAREFWVARRGEAYVSGIAADSRISVEWKSQQCPITMVLPPLRDDIPRVPVRCEGVKR
ncbi:MAG: fimbria/pilus outer membrane usher protein, partial [Ramlibacter sp.]